MSNDNPYHGFVHVDEPITPIENEIDLTPTPKEKRYQFRSTARAWKSKYQRNIGAKQIRKQLDAELKDLPEIHLIELAFRFKSGQLSKNLPEQIQALYQERFTHHLKRFNVSYENDIPTLPLPPRSDDNQTASADHSAGTANSVLSSHGSSL